ncbi:MAG: FAD-dependent oxidoreductase [Armatimonadetes bacterium]|nr:FAD-dependent oxidoreductase [Armatimonadota bacterium]MDW8121859.1 FAD-dependent oxidoreductase [Armatimonadota bacterium]
MSKKRVLCLPVLVLVIIQLVGGTDQWHQVRADGTPTIGIWKLFTQTPTGPDGWVSVAQPQDLTYLIRFFPETRRVVTVTFRVKAPPLGSYGPAFGFCWGSPDHWVRRAVFFRCDANGWLRSQDIGSWFTWKSRYGWVNVLPFPPGQWLEVSLSADPTIGACRLSLQSDDGKKTERIVPFLHPLPFLNGFFVSNEGTQGWELAVSVTKIQLDPFPTAPRSLQVKPLSWRRLLVTWLPSESPDVSGYRIYRQGHLVARVPSDRYQWVDHNADSGQPHRYFIVAESHRGDSLPSWSTAALAVPPYQGVARGAPWDLKARYPIVVYGATPAGLSAAITAARLGHLVALIEPSDHVGGMMTGGLSATDRRHRQASGGLFLEFVKRVENFYRVAYGDDSPFAAATSQGYYFEPKIALQIWTRLLLENPRVHLYLNQRLVGVLMKGNRPAVALLADKKRGLVWRLEGKIFIDATYEGDLAAKAGCLYRVGREGRDEFGEEFAGEVFWDASRTDLPPEKRITFGSRAGDNKVQAYNYRLTVTNRADNRVAISAPPGYDPQFYREIADRVREKVVWHPLELVSLVRLPGLKWDANNTPGPFPSTDFIGANYEYPESEGFHRWWIAERHRRYILGLLYFVQTNEDLPPWFRLLATFWSLAADEFLQTNNFPPQLYVREARRIIGDYIFYERDARPIAPGQRTPVHCDSIAVAEYPIDSHTCTPRDLSQPALHEGFFYLPGITAPSHLPYRILLPRRQKSTDQTVPVEGLLVVGAVSATHIGFGTIRLEPVWIALGQAAGTAAHLALTTDAHGVLRKVDIDLLQKRLLEDGQVIAFFDDLPPPDSPDFAPIQFFAVKGFFPTYRANLKDVLSAEEVDAILQHFVSVLPHGPDFPPFPASSEPPQQKDLQNWVLSYLSRQSLDVSERTRVLVDAPDRPITRGSLFRFLYRLYWLYRESGKAP